MQSVVGGVKIEQSPVLRSQPYPSRRVLSDVHHETPGKVLTVGHVVFSEVLVIFAGIVQPGREARRPKPVGGVHENRRYIVARQRETVLDIGRQTGCIPRIQVIHAEPPCGCGPDPPVVAVIVHILRTLSGAVGKILPERAFLAVKLAETVLPGGQDDATGSRALHGHDVIVFSPPRDFHAFNILKPAVGVPDVGEIERKPEVAVAVNRKSADVERKGRAAVLAEEVAEPLRRRVIRKEPQAVHGHPDTSAVVDADVRDLAAQGGAFVAYGIQRDEAVTYEVVAARAVVGANPEISVSVGTELSDEVGVKTEVFLTEIAEAASVVTAEAVLGGEPDESVGVLGYGGHAVEGQPVVGGEMREIPALRTRRRGVQRGCGHGQQEQDSH